MSDVIHFSSWLSDNAPNSSLWTLFLSSFISSTLAPGGSEVLVGVLAKADPSRTREYLLVASVGNSLGALTTIWAGRWASQKWPLSSERSKKNTRAIHSVKRYGYPLLLLSWLPLIGDGFCFAAGWLRMSLPAAIFLIVVGKTIRYAIVIAIAQSI